MSGMGLGLGMGLGAGGCGFSAEYGMSWNQTTDVYTRLGYTPFSSVAVGAKPAEYLFPFSMRRCVVSDAGVVQYYLSPTDSTKKADGSAADLTGTDGQVMVEILPKYLKYSWSDPTHNWRISNVQLPGYTLHPAFPTGNSKVYVGAYEGYIAGGKLCSISGVLPTVNKPRAEFRGAALERGTGWHQQSFWGTDLLQRLYAIEYADFDSQAILGRGVDQYSIWPGTPQALTGNTNSIGNASGNNTAAVPVWAATTAKTIGQLVTPIIANNYTYRCTTAGTTGGSQPTWPTTIGSTVADGGVVWTCVRIGQYVSYRGIENLFGHIWKFVDGINIHNSSTNRSCAYVCDNPVSFADDTETNYSLVGTLAETNGYARNLAATALGLFLPGGTSGGSSSTGLADYYHTYFDTDSNSGWRICMIGGYANYGLYAGAFYWRSNIGSSSAFSSVGGRLCFTKT